MDDNGDTSVLGCCWHDLLCAPRSTQHVHLFVCLRAWRYAVLRRKHRFHVATPREWRDVHFFEQELPLHAAVVALDHHGHSLNDAPFELMAFICAASPRCAERIDECRRPPLFYALEQRWRLDKLAWLVGPSLPAILEIDTEGLSLLTHAVTHACPAEMTIWMAVAAARACLEETAQLLDRRLDDSARRYCERMLRDFFAGVPEFPLAHCRALLVQQQHDRDSVVSAVQGIQGNWRAFVDKWGYYGAPVIQRDVPPLLTALIDSFVQVAVVAKGEPLQYQWFRDGAPLPTATHALLYIAQTIQPHNAGLYYCKVRNRHGVVVSTVMRVEVVDDNCDADPTRQYRVPRALLQADDIVQCVSASTGALLRHSGTGAQLLLPPYCFHSVDVDGHDVSDTQGLDVVLRSLAVDDDGTTTLSKLELRISDTLVSVVVEVLPHAAPTLLRPATLLLPHCMSTLESSRDLVVVRVDPATGKYEDVVTDDAIRPNPSSSNSKRSLFVCVDISAFGVFAVVARCPLSSRDTNHTLEQAKLFVVRPARIASAAFSRNSIQVSLWIARDRPDALKHARAHIERHLDAFADSDASVSTLTDLSSDPRQVWTIDTLDVSVRRNNVLCIEIGKSERFVYEWTASGDAATSASASTRRLEQFGCDCIAAAVQLQPSELMTAADSDSDQLPPFWTLHIDVAVHKLHASAVTRLSTAERFAAPTTARAAAASVLLNAKEWRVLVPTAIDALCVPPMPSLMQRSPNHVVLEFDAIKHSTAAAGGSRKRRDSDVAADASRFAECDEREREFTPYVYVVELAVFTETFWQRYDRAWWFDKTHAAVIDGMYTVVHAGVEPFATIATDAFAGCVRVVQCSIDALGTYSEPLLLEPLTAADVYALPLVSSTASAGTGGLVQKLRAIQRSSSSPRSTAVGSSAAMAASRSRLEHVLATLYVSEPLERVGALLGFPIDSVECVVASLAARRTTCFAANLELALLRAALQGVAACVGRMFVHARSAAQYVAKLRLVERLVSELDCFPVAFFATVTTELHSLVLQCFRELLALSEPGWFGHFLLGESLESELQRILEQLEALLTRDGSGATLRSASDIARDLAAFRAEQASKLFGGDVDRAAAVCMQRTFALQVLGQYESLPTRDAKRRVAQQLVRALELVPSSVASAAAAAITTEATDMTEFDGADTVARNDIEAHVVDTFMVELDAPSTREALAKLRRDDSLEQHVRAIAPADGETCARMPTRIAIHLDPLVTGVDTTQVVRVTNATLSGTTVHGAVAFSPSNGLLTFTPTVALERRMTYTLKVRCDAVKTCLGGALHGVLRYRFATP